ncbi:hypothetical protein LXL04_020527 [Taraxacum kok-saghyz]
MYLIKENAPMLKKIWIVIICILFVKLLESYINLMMCLAIIRLWLVEREEKEAEKEARRMDLEQSPLDILSKRSTEIQHITRECDENCIYELRMDRNAFARLCDLLQTRSGLLDDGVVTIEEQEQLMELISKLLSLTQIDQGTEQERAI